MSKRKFPIFYSWAWVWALAALLTFGGGAVFASGGSAPSDRPRAGAKQEPGEKEGTAGRSVPKESPIVGSYWVEEKPGEKVSREDAIKSLPCFGCHSIESFTGLPVKGKFSHTLHKDFGVHCNQCHEVKGHMPPRIIDATCNGCHSLKDLAYAGGGMGRVGFSHKRHTGVFKCTDCHISLFTMKKGSVKMLMDDMYKGKLCGACHNGKAAFASEDCTRCHKG